MRIVPKDIGPKIEMLELSSVPIFIGKLSLARITSLPFSMIEIYVISFPYIES